MPLPLANVVSSRPMLGTCQHCGGQLAVGAIACFRCGRLVARAEDGGTSGTGASVVVAPTNLGTVARSELLENQWRLVKPIGQGAVGQVWQAHDITLDRFVAVKVMHESVAKDAAQIARFEREARVLASLEHPNLLPVLGSGRFNDRPFLVTRLLEGKTLAELMHQRGGRLPPGEAAKVLAPICEALTCLHAAQVVHRDLKPSNILVGDDGRVTLMDLGSALEGGSELTRAGELLGTPGYLSPEQIGGNRGLDGKSDVYALGCLLYEVLAGKPPFEGEPSQVISAHLTADRPLASGAPAELAELARLAMSVSADARPTAAQFKDRLGRFAPTDEVTTPTAAPLRTRSREVPTQPEPPRTRSRDVPTVGVVFTPTAGTAAFPAIQVPERDRPTAPAPLTHARPPETDGPTSPLARPLVEASSVEQGPVPQVETDTGATRQSLSAVQATSTRMMSAMPKQASRPRLPRAGVAAGFAFFPVVGTIVWIGLMEKPAAIPEPVRVDYPAVAAPVAKADPKGIMQNLQPARSDRIVYVPDLTSRHAAINALTGAAQKAKRGRGPDRSRVAPKALRITTTWNGDVSPVLCWYDGRLQGRTPVLIEAVAVGVHKIEVEVGEDERRTVLFPMPKNARMKEGVRLEIELNEEALPLAVDPIRRARTPGNNRPFRK